MQRLRLGTLSQLVPDWANVYRRLCRGAPLPAKPPQCTATRHLALPSRSVAHKVPVTGERTVWLVCISVNEAEMLSAVSAFHQNGDFWWNIWAPSLPAWSKSLAKLELFSVVVVVVEIITHRQQTRRTKPPEMSRYTVRGSTWWCNQVLQLICNTWSVSNWDSDTKH